MKICNIFISSFGKLHNVNIDITDNFNAFIKNNGEGKSTLFNFIYAMFYGAGKNSLKDIRGLYLPWNERVAAGSIIFINNNITYKLERKFGKTQKNDEAHLYDLDLGKEVFIDKNYGEYFFNLTDEAFKSTLFVRQSLLMVNENTSLNDLLINTINTGEANMSIDNSNNRLNELDKIINVNNRYSKAYLLKNEEIEIDHELYDLQLKSREANDLLSKIEYKEKQINDLNDKMNFYNNVLDYQDKKNNYTLYLKYIELKNEEIKSKSDNKLDTCLIELNNIYITQAKKPNIIYIILAILSLLFGILLGILIDPYYYFIASGFIIFLFIYLYFYKKYLLIKANDEKLKSDTYKKYNANNYQGALKNILEKENEKNEELVNFSKKYDINNLFKYKDFKTNEIYEGFDDILQKIEECKNQISKLNDDILFTKGILSKIDNSKEIANLIERKNNIIKTLNHYHKIYEQYELAKSFIQDASDDVYHNFTPILMKEFKNVLTLLSGGKFKDLIIDASLNIFLDEGSNLYPLAFYSQGYKDMVYLALRIAIIKIVYKEKMVPIFLDDPLVNLDSNNKLLVANYLHDLAKTYQIFYFSCTNLD